MRWSILLVLIIVIPKEAFGEEKAKISSSFRSRRSLLSNFNVYKLDHFIELIEKIERHPLIKDKNSIETIANYVRRFGYNNQKWNKLLGTSEALPEGVLSTDEKRVLRGMVDHRFSGRQEHGVVNTPHGDVAMGPVITGICAGMNRNKDLILQEIYGLSSKHMDNLYAATIAGDIAQAVLINKADPSHPPLLGHGGTWSPDTECPEVFTLSNQSSPVVLTDARILGGMDGFLLGLKIHEWWSVTKAVRLGQLLRMYYRDGVVYNQNYAACRRFDTFREMAGKKGLIDQAVLSMYALKKVWHEGVDFSGVQTSAIPKLAGTTTELLFGYLKKLGKNRAACPKLGNEDCEVPANLLFVMDESGSIGPKNYEIEKDFVKNITDAINISPYETRVAVIEYSSSALATIKLNEYASKSRLKCAVDRLAYSGGSTYTSKAIELARDILQKAKSEAQGIRQNDPKIIILLTDGKSDGGERVLKPLVTSLKRNMTGLTIVSVGIGNYDKKELELIATDPVKHVFTATDFGKMVNLVKSLQNRTCKASVALKPLTNKAQKGGGENGKKTEAKVSGYVSPGKARYFTLPKETLFKTQNISIEIKPSYGTVTLYISRTNDSPGPDNYDYKIEVGNDASISRKKRSTSIAQGNARVLQLFNLCKGYNVTTCPPLHFAVVGKNSSQPCSDLDCSVPTQIKFELKTEQIIPKKENLCYYELQASKIHEAKDISVKISAVKDTVSYYISRVPEIPDSYDNSYKIKHVAAGRRITITIPTPCKEYNKSTCPPVYFFFRGAQLMCNCTAGRNCTLPSQVDIKVHYEVKEEDKDEDEVKLEPKDKETVCYHQVNPEQLFDQRMVEIKVLPVNDTITLYSSRVTKYPDKSNHSAKIDTVAVGQTNSLNISRPCKGFDRSSCPPLYLTFVGNQLTCNCTGKMGDQRCSLPGEVSVIFTKEASPSSTLTLQSSVCLIFITSVLSLLFG